MVRDLLVSHRGMSRLEAITISNLSAKIFGVQAVVILRQQSKIDGIRGCEKGQQIRWRPYESLLDGEKRSSFQDLCGAALEVGQTTGSRRL